MNTIIYMPKSEKVAVVNRSTKWIEKGKKRDKEEFVKKQETLDDTGGGVAQPSVDKNKLDTKTRKEEEPKKPVADATKNVVPFATKNYDSSEGSDSEDSSDEVEDAKNGPAPAAAKYDDDIISADEIGSDDDSISTEEIGPDNESESEDTSNEKEDAKNRSVAAAPTSADTYAWGEKIDRSNYTEPRPPIPPQECGCKLLFMSNLSPSIEEKDVRNFFKYDGKVVSVEFGTTGHGHVQFETLDASREALKRNGEMLMGYPLKLDYSEDRSIWDLITPNTKYKYVFMGNLSPSIKKNDVLKFFKADGTVKLVRLMTDGSDSTAYGHVKFASFDEALKAVQRGGKKLLGHKVELVLASESSVWHEYTPSSRKPPRFGVRRGPGEGSTKRWDGRYC